MVKIASILLGCTQLLATMFLTSVLAAEPPSVAPTGIRKSVDDALKITLSTMPATTALLPENAWWEAVSAFARPQLESARDNARQRIVELYQNYSNGSFKDFDAWFGTVEKPSIRLSATLLRGDWSCRAIQVASTGALSSPFHHCVIRPRGSCLELAKESGRRWKGCLHRVDEKNFAFVRARPKISPEDGFLSGASASQLRLVVADPTRLTIYEFIRR